MLNKSAKCQEKNHQINTQNNLNARATSTDYENDKSAYVMDKGGGRRARGEDYSKKRDNRGWILEPPPS